MNQSSPNTILRITQNRKMMIIQHPVVVTCLPEILARLDLTLVVPAGTNSDGTPDKSIGTNGFTGTESSTLMILGGGGGKL